MYCVILIVLYEKKNENTHKKSQSVLFYARGHPRLQLWHSSQPRLMLCPWLYSRGDEFPSRLCDPLLPVILIYHVSLQPTSGNIKQQLQGVGGHRVYVGIRHPYFSWPILPASTLGMLNAFKLLSTHNTITLARSPFLEHPEKFLQPKSSGKISNLLTTELFYSYM